MEITLYRTPVGFQPGNTFKKSCFSSAVFAYNTMDHSWLELNRYIIQNLFRSIGFVQMLIEIKAGLI